MTRRLPIATIVSVLALSYGCASTNADADANSQPLEEEATNDDGDTATGDTGTADDNRTADDRGSASAEGDSAGEPSDDDETDANGDTTSNDAPGEDDAEGDGPDEMATDQPPSNPRGEPAPAEPTDTSAPSDDSKPAITPEPDEDPAPTDSPAFDAGLDPVDTPSVPSWNNDMLPLFAASCGSTMVGCHAREVFAGQIGSDCRGWLSLADEPLGSTYNGEYRNGEDTGCPDVPLYERLLTTSWQCDDLPYVAPGDPRGSYLFRKIAGGPLCNNGDEPSMPMPMSGSLDEDQIELVRAWISAGAPQDN